MDDFIGFEKIPRLHGDIQMVITEKLDGTNAQILIEPSPSDADPHDMMLRAGSKNRWITPDNDNFGFARFCLENRQALIDFLGPGRHYGEWCGPGIQKNKYKLEEKQLFLFNTSRWGDSEDYPARIRVVPTLFTGPFQTETIEEVMEYLSVAKSRVTPGADPEGIIVYLPKSRQLFKRTFEYEKGKWGER